MKQAVALYIALQMILAVGTMPADVPQPTPAAAETDTTITMTFAGDVMLASLLDKTAPGNFNGYAAEQPAAYFLEEAAPVFQADDFTLVNLENALSDRALPRRDKGTDTAYWYKSKTSNTEILTSSGVEAVSLVNNHTHDYGNAGYQDTVKAVEAAGLAYGTESNTVFYEKDGFRVAVICAGLWSEGGVWPIVNRLKAAEEESNFQIVFYHGGEEGVHVPEAWKVRASRRLADAGADVVLGGHPHVLQPMEVYNGVDIVYSLGNFCFGGNNHPENRTVLYQLTLTVDKDHQAVNKESRLIPFYVYTGERNNYRPSPITDEAQARKVLDFMAWKEDSPL